MIFFIIYHPNASANNEIQAVFHFGLFIICFSSSRISRLMKDSIPLNEKYRMCIASRDLNYERNNFCSSVKDDVFSRNLEDVFVLFYL